MAWARDFDVCRTERKSCFSCLVCVFFVFVILFFCRESYSSLQFCVSVSNERYNCTFDVALADKGQL
jgi:hypothetical protein